ncbi:MAG: cation:proton antiporter [Deltaproteobacteria bacterium]|nr:cation:proton antiporter [Deltaproteobacteria bacterium]
MAITPLGGHAVYLLLIQVALLLTAARVGAELARRLGLPAVVGELAAGIVLGPTVFGHYLPHLHGAVFPADATQFHLLDVVGTLGMVLLLLLTGLETDLRLLRNLGRAALIASGTGMLVPFGMGLVLGLLMPDQYLAHPDQRLLFAAFLATAMSISAMPVIAKILMDLDLTKRNIGLVILSAGVVDDTAGWLILSIIAGAATHGSLRFDSLALTLGYLALFLFLAAAVVYPLLRFLIRVTATRFRTSDADLVAIVVVALLCAAATERIGVHAVFGAFVAGTVLRQVPRLSDATVHRLESFVFSVLSPVFFGIVGLKVDLWSLGSGWMLAVVVGVACLGKLVGCTVGGLWGGMRFWEAMSIAVAMNARGAMELVVASIGLSLGILNQQAFSMIVVVAVVTSFMAPLALRLTMRRVRMTEEEAKRIAAQESKGVFDPARVHVLVPTAGGPNALGAAGLALGIARRSETAVDVLYVDIVSTAWERLLRPFVSNPAGRGLDQHFSILKDLSVGARPPLIRRTASRDVASAIARDARKGVDLIVMGASQHGATLGGRVLEDVVEMAPCHVAIMKAQSPVPRYGKLLVPIDGSLVSKIAVEFAVRYAEVVGAELTLAVIKEHRPQAAAYLDEEGAVPQAETAPLAEEELERISRVFRASEVRPTILRLDYDPTSSALLEEVAMGRHDLVILGAENRAVQNRLFFGYDSERLIRQSPIAVTIVVPKLRDTLRTRG